MGEEKQVRRPPPAPFPNLPEQRAEQRPRPHPAPHLQDFYRLLIVHNALVFLHKCLRGVFNLIVRGALEHLCKARHERGVAVGPWAAQRRTSVRKEVRRTEVLC